MCSYARLCAVVCGCVRLCAVVCGCCAVMCAPSAGDVYCRMARLPACLPVCVIAATVSEIILDSTGFCVILYVSAGPYRILSGFHKPPRTSKSLRESPSEPHARKTWPETVSVILSQSVWHFSVHQSLRQLLLRRGGSWAARAADCREDRCENNAGVACTVGLER